MVFTDRASPIRINSPVRNFMSNFGCLTRIFRIRKIIFVFLLILFLGSTFWAFNSITKGSSIVGTKTQRSTENPVNGDEKANPSNNESFEKLPTVDSESQKDNSKIACSNPPCSPNDGAASPLPVQQVKPQVPLPNIPKGLPTKDSAKNSANLGPEPPKVTAPPSSPLVKARPPKSTAGFDKIYVINMRHRLDRRKIAAYIASELNFKIEFVPALGPDSQVVIDAKANATQNYIDGSQAGNFATHFGIWLHMKKHGIKSALILEDDTDAGKNAATEIKEVLASAPKDWGMLYFGHCFEHPNTEHMGGRVWRSGYPICTHAYAISEIGLSQNIPIFAKAITHLGLQTDLLLAESIKHNNIRSYSVHPAVYKQIDRSILRTDIASSGGIPETSVDNPIAAPMILEMRAQNKPLEQIPVADEWMPPFTEIPYNYFEVAVWDLQK